MFSRGLNGIHNPGFLGGPKQTFIFPWVFNGGLMVRSTARLSTRSCHETHYCYCSPKACLNPTGGASGKNGWVATNNGPLSHQKETTADFRRRKQKRDAGKNATIFLGGGFLVCISYTRFFLIAKFCMIFFSVQQQDSGNVTIRQMRP